MSMTQEEIEALMGDSVSDEQEEKVDDVDVDDLLLEIDGITDDNEDNTQEDLDINDMLEQIDGISSDTKDDSEENTQEDLDIDDMLDQIDGISSDTKDDSEENTQEDLDIDNMLNQIDDISDDNDSAINEESINNVEKTLEQKIETGELPLPSSKEHKIVNQLNEVAEDSEAKATQIFDVLSYILDENEKVSSHLNESQVFIASQIDLLEKLNNKFPNIDIIKENLESANNLKTKNEDSLDIINEENNKIFEAMEIMQYHDINRQKIERVMSVIKKLTVYLNGIFEDDSGKAEVKIAKHISGDSTETVNEDDLDSLISEFSQ